MVEPTTLSAIGAREIAARISSGALSAREAVEERIRRIQEVNPRLNAVVVPLFDQALNEAIAADNARSSGEPLGPLHGVPVTIKEQFMVAGTPTTVGLPTRAAHRAAGDGPLVRRLRRAGAIVLGKTNVSQMLVYHESDNPLYGRTNNPWDPDRTPGGSSGGEAAIIGARGSPLGLGGDFGGSIRIPAHFSGVHGLKPTAGRLTTLDTPTDILGLGQEAIIPQPGPMALTVGDLALAMEVLAAPGQEAIDPRVPPVPWRGPDDVSLVGLRVAAYTDDGFFRPAPALRRAVREAAAALRARGAQVEEWVPPEVSEAMRIYLGVASADGGAKYKRTLGNNERDRRITSLVRAAGLPGVARPAVGGLLERAGQRHMAEVLRSLGRRSASGYWKLVERRNRYRARFLAELGAGGFDAIICPPHALPALPHGASEHLLAASSYSLLYNVLGMPAGVVAATRVAADEESDRPNGRDLAVRAALRTEKGSAGLPVGVQVVARQWREDLVLTLMVVLEEHFVAQPGCPTVPI